MNTGKKVKKLLAITTVIIIFPLTALTKDVETKKDEVEGGLWNYKKLLLDENGKWSLGVGTIVRNSPFRGEKIDAFPVPIVDYSSKNLFIREMKAGYHIINVEDPYKGGFFFDTYLGARMRPGNSRRKFSIDAGLRGGFQHPMGAVSLAFTQDATGASDGKEASLSYSFTFINKKKNSIIIPRITVTWQDAKMANYLWGISQETTDRMIRNNDRVILQPFTLNQSVLNYSGGIVHVYKIGKHWNTVIGAQIAFLDQRILANPGIERDVDYSFIFATAYTF